MKSLHSLLIIVCFTLFALPLSAESSDSILVLDLNQTVRLAGDSSLSAFRAKNMYMASYWQYRSFRAGRLPSLMFYSTPLRYNRDITRRYDSQQNIDVYRRQQSLYTYGNLSAQQNFDLTGGTFFIDTELGYIHNMGEMGQRQFNSVPIRIGYRQELLGFNPFRWEKKIEPLKFEKAKKQLIYDLEETSQVAAQYFFAYAMAQTEYELAQENLNNAERLYNIGVEKQKIASIGQADLSTLKLDLINAGNSLKNAEIALRRASFSLTSYLHIDSKRVIAVKLPDFPPALDVTVEEALQLARQNNPRYLESKQKLLESEQILDQRRKESMFNLGINTSVGFNQVAGAFRDVYRDPLRQDIVSITLTIPLLDWGVRKGKYNMAKNNLNITRLTARQEEIKLEEEVIMTVGNFSVRQQMILSAREAMQLAKTAYEQTEERFIIGKADINSITLSANRRREAQRNYISSLQNYWESYYKLRKLTLYDFALDRPIDVDFSSVNEQR